MSGILFSTKRVCITWSRNDRTEPVHYSHATIESSHGTVDSIQDTVGSSQDNEAFTQYKNYEVGLDLKVDLEHLKVKVVK